MAEETLFQAVARQVPAIADSVSEQMRSAVTNRLTSEVARMQKAAGEAETLRQNAATEAAALDRAIAAKRGEGVRLDEANAEKQRRGEELDAQNAEKAAKSRALDDDIERKAVANAALNRVAPAVAV